MPSTLVWKLATLLVTAVASIGQADAQTAPPPEQLAAMCVSCHRLDNKPSGIPPIVTLGERQIIAMMRAYRTRPRSSPTMHVVSHALSDPEIVALAGYLSRRAGKAIR